MGRDINGKSGHLTFDKPQTCLIVLFYLRFKRAGGKNSKLFNQYGLKIFSVGSVRPDAAGGGREKWQPGRRGGSLGIK
jgi:hypothetical protein